MTKVDFSKGERGKYVKRLQKQKREHKSGLTADEFRAEVQKYLETGQSDVLTAVEKATIDTSRPKPSTGIWASIKAWFKK